jgi:hypothetical protein
VIKPIVISWAEGLNKYNAIALLAAVLYVTDETPTDAQLEHRSEPGGAELGMREFVLHHLGKRTEMGKLLSALPSQMDDFINAARVKWEAGYIGPRVHRYHASVSVTEGPIEYHVRRWKALAHGGGAGLQTATSVVDVEAVLRAAVPAFSGLRLTHVVAGASLMLPKVTMDMGDEEGLQLTSPATTDADVAMKAVGGADAFDAAHSEAAERIARGLKLGGPAKAQRFVRSFLMSSISKRRSWALKEGARCEPRRALTWMRRKMLGVAPGIFYGSVKRSLGRAWPRRKVPLLEPHEKAGSWVLKHKDLETGRGCMVRDEMRALILSAAQEMSTGELDAFLTEKA